MLRPMLIAGASLVLFSAFFAQAPTANAEKAPPGSSWYIHDSDGWAGPWQRVGTDGTLWDRNTVSFTGKFEKNGEHSRSANIEIHFSDAGALFAVRKDTDASGQTTMRTCVYLGQSKPVPNMLSERMEYLRRLEISGAFLCSNMDKAGAWQGEMN